ncbi:hypothetical protein [Ekhidna sp.]|uniref:hypothetical protein n=1 Tax=Ekhidna sp. TaxID=2608089 RepID=UPI0032EEE324
MKTLQILLTLLLFSCCNDSVSPSEQSPPKLLVGLSLQQYKNSSFGIDGYIDGLDHAVQNGINMFGMSPEWNVLEPSPNTYSLQDNLTNPLTLLDQNKTKLDSYIIVLKMIDTNIKLVPDDLANLDFDDPEMINRFSLLLDKIFTEVPSIERVTHVLIGNEIDGYLSTNPDQIQQFKTFYLAAIQQIHALNPRVKVGTIITFNAAKNNPILFDTFKTEGDFICYTYYPTDEQNSTPWQMRPPSDIKDDMDWMVQNTGGKPIAFTEIGYTSSTDNSSSEQQQSDFVQKMFSSMKPYINSKNIEFVYYHGMYDYPQGFCNQYAQQQGVDPIHICNFMNHLGLNNWETGLPKLAWFTFIDELRSINE